MLVKSKQPFNAMGYIASEAGTLFYIDSPFTVIQLKQMKFIEEVNEETKPKKKK